MSRCKKCQWQTMQSVQAFHRLSRLQTEVGLGTAPRPGREPSMTTPPLRSVELFGGAGGLALGTHEAGFRPEMFVEWDRWA